MNFSQDLRAMLDRAGATWMNFGPGENAPAVVESFGFYHAEYAAVRRGVGILVMPWRAVLRLTGTDRQDFLQRMTTADVGSLRAGGTLRAFQLNDKGRIIADALVLHGDLDTWMELDCFDLPALMKEYDRRLIADDVTMEDWTGQRLIAALHGPQSAALLRRVAAGDVHERLEEAGTHHVLDLGDARVTVWRHDECGVPGYRLAMPPDVAAGVLQRLAEAVGGLTPQVEPGPDQPGPKRELFGRGIGWAACNTARIEAGSPLFHIDYGTDCLPHETGILREVVNFKKGCYLGQEVVARMEHLGHPKRMLVRLRFRDDRMPIAGTPVLTPDPGGDVIGAVTSSTVSPLAGNTAIALAMVKWGWHTAGKMVKVGAEGTTVEATVAALRE